MAGAFGLLSDNHPSHFSGDRLIESNARLIIWDLFSAAHWLKGP
jgi:hypothetical protein